MAMDLESISSDAVNKPPRIVLLGREKAGKTSFACGDRVENGKIVEWGINKPVVISVKGEEGADAIPVAKFPVAQTYEDVMEALNTLCKEEHDFQTVVIDSISTLYRRVKEAVMRDNPKDFPSDKEYDRFNRGPQIAVGYFEQIHNALTYLRDEKGMSSIVIGHVKTKTVNSPDIDPYDAWVWDVPDIIANLFYRASDSILFAQQKGIVKKDGEKFGAEHRRAVDVGNGERVLYTQSRLKHPGGGRGVYGQLPYELDFSWSAYIEAVAAAVNNETTK